MRPPGRLLPPVGLFLLGPAAYHGILTPGSALADYDVYLYFVPYREYLAAAWRAGRLLPLWNPAIFLGVPFLANIQAAALYPPNLLFLLLTPEQAIGWLIALHAGLAGSGMYLVAERVLRLRTAGSLVAGAVYMLSAFMVMHAGHLNQSNTLGWTPWLILAADRAAHRPAPRRLAAVAILVALVILAGHTQQAYFSFVLAAGFGLRRLWLARSPARALWRGAALLGSVVLGAGLAALQLAATLELTRQSVRSGGLSITDAATSSLPLRSTLVDLLPDYAGEHRAEFAASIGGVALALVALALVSRWRRAWPWALIGATALAGAYGPKLKLYTLLFHAVPGLALFRAPARLLLFTVVAAAVLSGLGTVALLQHAAAWRRGRRPWARPALALALALAPFAILAGAARLRGLGQGVLVLFPTSVNPINLAIPTALLVAAGGVGAATLRWPRAVLGMPALVACDLLLLASPTYPMNPLPDSLYHDRPAALELFAPSPDSRHLALVPFEAALPEDDRVPGGLSPADRRRYAGFLRQLDPLVPDLGMSAHSLDADGYDGGLLPTRRYVAFRRPLLPAGSGNQPDFTDHLLTDRAHSCEWLREAAVATVLTAGQDPNPEGERCLVRGASTRGLTAWSLVPAAPRARMEDGMWAAVIADDGERLVVAIPNGETGRLLLADAWYPGWTARAGGRELEVQRRDGYTRSVSVPPGAPTVTFEYRPGWLRPALALTALALLVTISLIAWPAPRRGAAARRPSAL